MSAASRAFVPFFIFGGLFVGMSAYKALDLALYTQDSTEAQHWPTTPGTITESGVAEHVRAGPRGGHQTSYAAAVSYTYAVDGTPHTGHRIQYGALETGNPDDARATLSRYPVGAPVTVHYQQGAPDDATLELAAPSARSWRRALAPGGFGLIFWLFGGVAAWRIGRKNSRRPYAD